MSRSSLHVMAAALAMLAIVGCGGKSGGPAAPVPQPLSIHSGDILVTDSDSTAGRVIAIDTTGVQTVIASSASLKYPAGVVVAPNGDLLVAVEIGADGQGGIYRIARGNGAVTAVNTDGLVHNPTGIVVDAGGNIFTPCEVPDTVFGGGGSSMSGTVVEISAAGAVTVLTTSPLSVTYGIAMESGGTVVVNAGFFPSVVSRINPVSRARIVVSSGGSLQPFLLGIAVDGTGNILVAGDASGVVRVNPTNGSQATVSSGGSFQRPFGIALDAQGKILVADAGGGVLRVDPSTGAQTTVAWGSPMIAPTAVAIVP